MRYIAFESSCDESALALFDSREGLLGEWVHSQIALHGEYGGVVPDLASREHVSNFGPLLQRARQEVALEPVDRIAVTVGPGLAGCLAVGIAAAKSLALALGAPLIGVNHLRGHAFSPFIALHAEAPEDFEARFQALLPHVGLLVSGGNTVLFLIDRDRRISLLAQTVDDAAGEAIDKGAKLLGMPYPGGVQIENAAANGETGQFNFPTGIPDRSDFRFSFSGLKTSLRYQLEAMGDAVLAEQLPNICADYQAAVVRQLVNKTRHVLEGGGAASLGLSGGVANNTLLREEFAALSRRKGLPLFMAERRHTGDNAAMIAFAAWLDPEATEQSLATMSFNPAVTLA
ncbi:tRNA (adenosine(37)-N6)-threonylcarbamoyltransferase complex transferase subunit TsaD [Cerasicoccus arenae]|uniref:tRNA N6-adenosine threonylcarbamoyltransferase n=1 Tax=Cerasicoccus arenae TaxID=424488 RepID=A0A8J3DA03_9BACT|nr:tRNA (adenosine(37)-N6)-threonylcarbamoyltransferase complex transferase subunit TsaD [Cerasicoccus arenae]MBK1857480.1 tRNA (adenosine(37)-N6)-threonylcarbamoyltransferase complex transferase subunit TsaD [Cerasicoccus arenae]GHB95272.1 tRNA N6-adenosine threonylcarbamoyltransferase [Cerasicoccus arenae]